MSVDTAVLLMARHERMRPRADSARLVLGLVDDPDTAALDVALAIGKDPVFAARVLRVANSSYYGLGGRVSTLRFAVSVIGFQAVRGLAVVAAAGLDDPEAAPPGFWEAAALSATAAEVVAPHLEADAGDAFCVGLLHLLGAALLHQQQTPSAALCLPEDPAVDLRADEIARHGIAHDEAAARVLESWHVPHRLVEVIAEHHRPVRPTTPGLPRALAVARSVAGLLLTGTDLAGEAQHLTWLSAGRIPVDAWPRIVQETAKRSAVLLEGLLST